MPFRPTLVALSEDATDYPYLGFHVLEIPIMQHNDENAGIPKAIGFESRDKFSEGVTGADTKVDRRKLADLEMTIDFVSAEVKAEIERLQLDGRTVYFCPNMNAETRWSFPLQRSLEDFTGNKTLENTRAGDAYLWDPVDKVFRVFDDDEPQLGFHGAWSRFLRTQSNQPNKATNPFPAAVGHGWTVVAGTVTFTYSEDMLTPILSRRSETGSNGVLFCEGAGGLTASIKHGSVAISSTLSVVGSICMAWTGDAVLILKDGASGTTYDTVLVAGDGTFQLTHLSGINSNAATSAEIVVVLADTNVQDQSIIIASVLISNGRNNTETKPRVIDWSFPTSGNPDLIEETDSVVPLITEGTLTFFAQMADTTVGYVQIGNVGKRLEIFFHEDDHFSIIFTGGTSKSFSSMTSEFGLVVGQWYHFALTMGADGGFSLYVNGEAHSTNGSVAFESGYFDSTLVLGFGSGGYLDNSGISHLRLDGKEWTQQEVKDHYATYFKGAGRGVVEPLFGKELVIEAIDWVPNTVSDSGAGDVHWRASMVLRELGPVVGLAGLQRQEGTP